MGEIIAVLNGFNTWSVIFRIVLSVIIGGCIGLERRQHGHAAGTRTFSLVCVGSAVAAMTGIYMNQILNMSTDPARICAQVVSGIGFLGAGTIMTYHSQKTGLTTAAGLWTTACMGVAIGAGFYMGTAAAFIAVMITYMILGKFGPVSRGTQSNIIYVEIDNVDRLNEFVDTMYETASILKIEPAKTGVKNHVGLELGMANPSREKIEKIRAIEYVTIALMYS